MENYVVIATFPDPRKAYYLKFKLGLKGIITYIIESDEAAEQNNESKPLKVQVDDA